jgi:hypothetical protein
VPHKNTITSLLLLALIFPACDEAGDSRYDELRSGTDTTSDTGDTTDDTTTGVDDDGLPIPVGQNFGPCFSDSDHIYHWCDPAPAVYPLVCAVPQEDGKPYATVCTQRRPEGKCPLAKGFVNENNMVIMYTQEQDYWNACPLVCDVDADCPSWPEPMICSSGICAWETF